MKTKIIIGILLFLITTHLFGQEPDQYTGSPFLKEGRVWNCERFYHNFSLDSDENIIPETMTWTTEQYYYVQKGDTLIEDVSYKRIYKYSPFTFDDEQLHYFAAAKEDDGRVFIIPKGKDKETILYDFTAIADQEVVSDNHVFKAVSRGRGSQSGPRRWSYDMVFLSSDRQTNNSVDQIWVESLGSLDIEAETFHDPFEMDDWFGDYTPLKATEYTSYSKGYLVTCMDENYATNRGYLDYASLMNTFDNPSQNFKLPLPLRGQK